MTPIMRLLFISILCGTACSHKSRHRRTHMLYNRTVIVQLFEWKWIDIAEECERFLGPNGYGAVQTSPASENLAIYLEDGTRPWFERYQVMSYIMQTRSGSEEDFLYMTTKCNKVGVRIYVDVVFNHMTSDYPINGGTAGSSADFANMNYPAVPYSQDDFHYPPCDLKNYENATEVRNCKLLGLKDLNQTKPYVRAKIVQYLNKLISHGVAGFRVDAAKHMWPEDLKQIYLSVDNLNTNFGFPKNSRPYIYQEVNQGGAVTGLDYKAIGDVTEFAATSLLHDTFGGSKPLAFLQTWGRSDSNMLPSAYAVVFVDNHDTQRFSASLNYKNGAKYQAAIAFLLAHRYGQVRIMSSFRFDNEEEGPPSDRLNHILSPIIDAYGRCDLKWVCEHRWNSTVQMIKFRDLVRGTKIKRWWDNGNNQVAFSRGRKGFVAFNLESKEMYVTLQTGLPAGKYCDIRSGQPYIDSCTGRGVLVDSKGQAKIFLSGKEDDLYLAIHVGPESRLETI